MARELRNVGAPVRARLLECARAERSDFQILLTRYALERLLYRLSISAERDRFVLKGAMLFVTWFSDPFRPTHDLDLLGHGDPDATAIAERFRTICAAPAPDDGVVFDVDGLEAATIRDEAEYGGVRVRTTATIAGARVPIQVDVGFGDAITPEAIEIDYPALLDAPSPHLRAYPPETVVAEKAEATVSLGVANSRMKDFYDLWMIARTFRFERTCSPPRSAGPSSGGGRLGTRCGPGCHRSGCRRGTHAAPARPQPARDDPRLETEASGSVPA